jgi:hypothetical protein
LKQHGIEPAPERQKRTTWQEFLKIHWDVHSAVDFSTVDAWTTTSVLRSAILFVIDLAACRVDVFASGPDPITRGSCSAVAISPTHSMAFW